MRHKRIIVTRYGGPDTLQVIEEECPQPQPGEVRVQVLAAGVSLPDVLARMGRLAGVEMCATCSAPAAEVVKELGATPIDYRNSDFVREIHCLAVTVWMLLSTASVGTIYGAHAKRCAKAVAW